MRHPLSASSFYAVLLCFLLSTSAAQHFDSSSEISTLHGFNEQDANHSHDYCDSEEWSSPDTSDYPHRLTLDVPEIATPSTVAPLVEPERTDELEDKQNSHKQQSNEMPNDVTISENSEDCASMLLEQSVHELPESIDASSESSLTALKTLWRRNRINRLISRYQEDGKIHKYQFSGTDDSELESGKAQFEAEKSSEESTKEDLSGDATLLKESYVQFPNNDKPSNIRTKETQNHLIDNENIFSPKHIEISKRVELKPNTISSTEALLHEIKYTIDSFDTESLMQAETHASKNNETEVQNLKDDWMEKKITISVSDLKKMRERKLESTRKSSKSNQMEINPDYNYRVPQSKTKQQSLPEMAGRHSHNQRQSSKKSEQKVKPIEHSRHGMETSDQSDSRNRPHRTREYKEMKAFESQQQHKPEATDRYSHSQRLSSKKSEQKLKPIELLRHGMETSDQSDSSDESHRTRDYKERQAFELKQQHKPETTDIHSHNQRQSSKKSEQKLKPIKHSRHGMETSDQSDSSDESHRTREYKERQAFESQQQSIPETTDRHSYNQLQSKNLEQKEKPIEYSRKGMEILQSDSRNGPHQTGEYKEKQAIEISPRNLRNRDRQTFSEDKESSSKKKQTGSKNDMTERVYKQIEKINAKENSDTLSETRPDNNYIQERKDRGPERLSEQQMDHKQRDSKRKQIEQSSSSSSSSDSEQSDIKDKKEREYLNYRIRGRGQETEKMHDTWRYQGPQHSRPHVLYAASNTQRENPLFSNHRTQAESMENTDEIASESRKENDYFLIDLIKKSKKGSHDRNQDDGYGRKYKSPQTCPCCYSSGQPKSYQDDSINDSLQDCSLNKPKYTFNSEKNIALYSYAESNSGEDSIGDPEGIEGAPVSFIESRSMEGDATSLGEECQETLKQKCLKIYVFH